MFDNEIRGQLAMLMGGRAAEELTCGHLSTGMGCSRQSQGCHLGFRHQKNVALPPASLVVLTSSLTSSCHDTTISAASPEEQ